MLNSNLNLCVVLTETSTIMNLFDCFFSVFFFLFFFSKLISFDRNKRGGKLIRGIKLL